MILTWLNDLRRDISVSTRLLKQRPGFSAMVVLILALAIGLTATVFSFVEAILLRPLPYTDADRLVLIRSVNPSREMQAMGVSRPDLVDWREQSTSFEGIAAFRLVELDFTDGTSTRRYRGMASTSNFFEVFGLEMELGRFFSIEDEEAKSLQVVLGNGVWRSRFNASPTIVGQSQDIYTWRHYPKTGTSRWQILGASAIDVPFPPTNSLLGHSRGLNDVIDFWVPPWSFVPDDRADRYEFTAVGKLRAGVSVDQASAELKEISKRLAVAYPDTNRNWTTELVTMNELVTGEIRPSLLLLCGAAGLLLLIACANVASLLIVRGLARQQEFAVRLALGADRKRVIRQLVTESVFLCWVGGLIGVLLAFGCVEFVQRLAPPAIPRLQEVDVNLLVVAFSFALSLATGIFVGILPAALAARVPINDTLKGGGRSATTTRTHGLLMKMLVGGELAVSIVLLTGALLLIRSFIALIAVDPGFRAERLLTMTVSPPQAKHEWKFNSDFCVDLVTQLRAVPGVTSASAIRGVPTRETRFDALMTFEGRPILPRNERPQGTARVVEPGFFETMEIPLLEGRLFEPNDSVGEIGLTRVTICNETFARRFFPGESALGKRFTVIEPGKGMMEIVGVVGDVRYSGLRENTKPAFYYPEALFPQTEFTLLIRTTNEPSTMMATVEKLVRDTEPDVIIQPPETMSDVLSASLSREKFLMMLISAFSCGAFALAVTGHYGVMSYSVSQRRRELAIRMALGSTPGNVVQRIVVQGMSLALIGLVVGVAASLAITRLLQSELYGIQSTDPTTLVAVVVVMLVASVVASLIPSLRAAAIAPAIVLRCE